MGVVPMFSECPLLLLRVDSTSIAAAPSQIHLNATLVKSPDLQPHRVDLITSRAPQRQLEEEEEERTEKSLAVPFCCRSPSAVYVAAAVEED